MRMQLTEYYRNYELPWEVDPEGQGRLRRLVSGALLLLLLFSVILPFIHLPKQSEAPEAVPERLARLMVEEKPKPPPVVEPPKPKPETKPVPVPKPVDKTAEARKKALNSGLFKLKDELADLRQNVDLTPLGQTKNLQGAVGEDSHAERSLIASKAGGASAGITSANASRGFGTGAGSLTGHDTTAVSSRIAAAGTPGGGAQGGSGEPTRTQGGVRPGFDS